MLLDLYYLLHYSAMKEQKKLRICCQKFKNIPIFMCSEVQYAGMINILDAFTIDAVMQDITVKSQQWCLVVVVRRSKENVKYKNFIVGKFNEDGYLEGKNIT